VSPVDCESIFAMYHTLAAQAGSTVSRIRGGARTRTRVCERNGL